MNTFTRKSLYAALAGLGALGAASPSQAVNVNPDGLGQVLIYPYYTARANAAGNAYNSLLSVVNSTGSAKAVKVRILEGKNSREVIDFNLFLSRFDVWTAAIVPTASGARLVTSDRSCTIPQIPAGGVEFVNFAYSGALTDKATESLDRTREGYIELIEMATYDPLDLTWERVTHDPPGGTPPGCAENNDIDAATEADPPSGGLFGGMQLVNVNEGNAFSNDAVALDNFSDTSIYANAGSIFPTLEFVSPPVSVTFNGSFVTQSTWTRDIDAVSAVLMHDNVLNEFVLDAGTLSGTDWVVTFPTKRFYVPNVGSGNNPVGLFQRNFNGNTGSCDDIAITLFDREELNITVTDFSPPRGGLQICWEANVLTFNNSNVLASTNISNVSTGFQNGWANLAFFPVSGLDSNDHRLDNFDTSFLLLDGTFLTGRTASYFGLPVVGFEAHTFTNGTLSVGGQNVLSKYGVGFNHKFTNFVFDFGPTLSVQ